jgi:hypothetical protein
MLELLFNQYIQPYLIIGTVISLTIDGVIRLSKSGEPFTVIEVVICILLWPSFLLQAIKGFFNREN